ncbi:hypothetical protein K438DRAFT_1891558, partial [Mycena galopus ATCC 62051]
MLRREPRSGAGDHRRKWGTGGHSECEGTTNASGEGGRSAPQRGRSGHDVCGATQCNNSGEAVQSRCRYRLTADSSTTQRGRSGGLNRGCVCTQHGAGYDAEDRRSSGGGRAHAQRKGDMQRHRLGQRDAPGKGRGVAQCPAAQSDERRAGGGEASSL